MAVEVERLFKQFTVIEVKDVERKVKNDIEKKKEDLRQMVGRRYQDIIDAADSINGMKRLSQHLLESVHNVQSSVSRMELLECQLAGTSRYKSKNLAHFESPEISARVLSKFLNDLTSLIWKSLDEDQCLDAAWLYRLSDYVHKLVFTYKSENIDQTFVEKSWSLISSQLQETCEHCFNILERISDHEIVLNCICALILAKNFSVIHAIEKFLSIRENLFVTIFESAEMSSRAQICAALDLIQDTIFLTDKMISTGITANQNAGDDSINVINVIDKIRTLKDGSYIPPCLDDFMKLQPSAFLKRLPGDVKEFKCSVDLTIPSENEVKVLCQDWVNKSTAFCRQKITDCLMFFGSIDALCTLKSSALESLTKTKPNSNTEKWILSSSLWTNLFADSLEKRLEEIVEERVKEKFEDIKLRINSCVQQTLPFKVNAQNFLFETDSKSAEHVQRVSIPQHRDMVLYLKSTGVPVELFKVIREFDEKLNELKTKLDNFFDIESKSSASSTGVNNNNNSTDAAPTNCSTKNDVMVYVADFLCRLLMEYIESVSNPDRIAKEHFVYNCASYAKICTCFNDLCPSLTQILIWNKPVYSSFTDHLKSKAFGLYKLCLEQIIEELCDTYIPVNTATANVINDKFWMQNIQEWDNVEINDVLDDGRTISSSIFVPFSLSANVSGLLNDLCQRLCSIGSHVMPRETIGILNAELYVRICRFYNKTFLPDQSQLAEGDIPSISSRNLNQKQAFQLIFDLKFLDLLLDYKKQHSTSIKDQTGIVDLEQIIREFESLIDPFDLDAANSFLNKNALRLAQRCQIIYSMLMTHETISKLQRKFAAFKSETLSADPSASTTTSTSLEKYQTLMLVNNSDSSLQQQQKQHTTSTTATAADSLFGTTIKRFYLLPVYYDDTDEEEDEKMMITTISSDSKKKMGGKFKGVNRKYNDKGRVEMVGDYSSSALTEEGIPKNVNPVSSLSSFYGKVSSTLFGN